MVQGSLGNLWLGTDYGLSYFDGKYFYHYTTNNNLGGNLIVSLCQDSKNNLWVGTFRGGLTKFDGKHMTTFTTEDGLLSNIINSVIEDSDGNIWIGTTGGLTKYDGKQFTNYTTKQGLACDDINSIAQDGKGRIWIATNGKGISIFDGKTFMQYSAEEGFEQDFVAKVKADKFGNIWIGTIGGGAIKYDGNTFVQYTKEQGLSSNSISDILRDRRGRIWFATVDGGISMLDGDFFHVFSEQQGLNSDCVRSILEDVNGTIWFGTQNVGLAKYSGDLFTHLSESDGLSNKSVVSILEEKPGTLWLATQGGYAMRCEEKVENGIPKKYFYDFGAKEGLLSKRVYRIIKDNKDRIWFASDNGVSVFDGYKTETYVAPNWNSIDAVRDVIQDKEGNFWFGIYGKGISKFDGKTFTNYTVSEGLSSNNIMSLFLDSKNRIWICTDGGGLTVLENNTFTHYTKKENFFANAVFCIEEDKKGNIWLGTSDDGLVKYDGENFIKYAGKEGIANNIYSLKIDREGNLWIGSRLGLSRIEKDFLDSNNPVLHQNQIKVYNYENGFVGVGCNLNAITEAADGKMWIGTNDRLSIYHNDCVPLKPSVPNMQITNLLIFNEEMSWETIRDEKDSKMLMQNGLEITKPKFDGISSWYQLPQNLKLASNCNYLTFSYVGIALNEVSDLKYEFMLEGIARVRNTMTDKNEISFGNLEPGKYTFKVKAVTAKGVESNQASFSFRIMPPWWKTWWFFSILLFLVISIVVLSIYIRERQFITNSEILKRKVREQTEELTVKNKELEDTNFAKDKLFSIIAHDLKGPFSSFLGLTQVMSDDLYSFTLEEINSFAQSMNLSARNIYALLENLLHWARMQQGTMIFTPKHINLSEIASDNMEWTIQAANDKQINLVIDIPDDIELQADDKMLQTVIRNIVNNAIKFTPRGGEILLRGSKRSDGFVEILVQDNGIGMGQDVVANLFNLNLETGRNGTEGEPSTGLGLIICKELVDKHDGSIKVVSVEGEGSKFIITVPMSH